MSKAVRLGRKWRDSTRVDRTEKDRSKTEKEQTNTAPKEHRDPLASTERRNLRIRSQHLFQSTKQRVTGRVYDKISNAGLEISPQNGFFYIRPTYEYLKNCITSPLVTLIDFRDQREYKELHLRTAINIPSKFLNLPEFEEAALQISDSRDKSSKEKREKDKSDENSDSETSLFTLEPLISEQAMESNHEFFKNTWIDDLLQYSMQKQISHQFVIYESTPRARRSTILPGVLHILKSIYRDYIEMGKLEIYVLKSGFEKIKNEKWMHPVLCASTDQFRKTQVYAAMEFTDDDVYTEVLPFLFLSSSIGATNEHQLRKNGITVILNLTEKQIAYPEGDFESIHICMADIRSQDATGPIEQANEIIDNARKNLGRVLVHCTRGQSRSPIIAIAYLMKSRGWPLLKSFLFVRQKRPWIGPNPSFMSQMMLYEDHLQLAHTSPFPLHAYTLLESRDEDFDENISALGLTAECPQDLFEMMDPPNLKKALHFIKDNTHLRYIRRSADTDETPLHYGVTLAENEQVDREVLLELLEELTDSTTINQDTLLGETPLIAAARQEDVCLVRFLLQHDADPGHINASGKNALHYASNCLGSEHSATAVEIVQELLKASRGHATVITDDIHGFNPIDYAKFSPELTNQLHSRFVEELLPSPTFSDHPADWVTGQMALFAFHVIRSETWKCVFNLFFGPKMQLGDEEMVLAIRVFESQCSLVFGREALEEQARNTSLSRRTRNKLLLGGKSKVCLYGSAAEISPRLDEVLIEHQVIHFIIDNVKEKLPDRHALHLLLISLLEKRELAIDGKPSLEVSVNEVLTGSADAISALLHSNFSVLSPEDGHAILNNALETIRTSLKSLRHYHRKPSTTRLLF